MTLNRGALLAFYFALLALIYAWAWSAPAIGLDHDAAANLVTARAIAGGRGYTIDSLPRPAARTNLPPLFPFLLALFTLVSQQAQWLKLLPLAGAFGWLLLTFRLLLKMGASRYGALLLLGLTAASPTVVFLSTNLLPETLFALLATGALLALLEERALFAGILAGLATLTDMGGIALIAACILTLAARRRFRGAAVFAAVAMVLAAPWFGWSLAHVTHDTAYTNAPHVPTSILTGLAANEKLVVLSRNLLNIFASPFLLLTGLRNTLSAAGALAILIWCFIVRRQLVPDLFVALYSVSLLLWIAFPAQKIAPILPLVLWIMWRVFRTIQAREAMAALILIAAVLPLWTDGSRLLAVHAEGNFPPDAHAPDNWADLRKLFTFIQGNTPPESVLLANLDGAFFLNSARKTTRGFVPNNYDLLYAPRQAGVTPDQLSQALARDEVRYVVLTPDRDLPESGSFHKSVEALARGGVIEPVSVPGLAAGYSLFQVAVR